jgi:hypothetical protein
VAAGVSTDAGMLSGQLPLAPLVDCHRVRAGGREKREIWNRYTIGYVWRNAAPPGMHRAAGAIAGLEGSRTLPVRAPAGHIATGIQ